MFKIYEMDLWFEIVLTIYGFVYLCLLGDCFDGEPELSEDMRKRLYT